MGPFLVFYSPSTLSPSTKLRTSDATYVKNPSFAIKNFEANFIFLVRLYIFVKVYVFH